MLVTPPVSNAIVVVQARRKGFTMDFDTKNILLDVDVSDKLSLFQYIAHYAKVNKLINKSEQLVEAFLKREEEVSTGLQDSFAIPHAKGDFIHQPAVIFLKLRHPISWETFDEQPVANVFALLVPSEFEGRNHLEMISKIATSLMEGDFTAAIKNTEDSKQLKEIITKAMKGEY